MNKFLVFLVTITILVWGIFLFKMSVKADFQKFLDEESMWEGYSGKTVQDIETRLDFNILLSRLNPQEMPADTLRDPFDLPASLFPSSSKSRVEKNALVTDSASSSPIHPSITLDAILSGDNPVAIIKFHGESAVVCVGQKVWNVVVKAIESDRVVLDYASGTFEIR